MSRNSKISARISTGLVEVKSKFSAEFRRFAVEKPANTSARYEDFYKLIEALHRLQDSPFVVGYTDPEGDLLPINNDDNYGKALTTAKPILRILVQKKGESYAEINGYGTVGRKKSAITKFIASEQAVQKRTQISLPHDFRRVSAIIDVDVIPETHRRVKLMKNGTDKPLGFYIRDGTSVRVTPHGLEKVPGIFISRLVPGGLAESTGLLAVNDEVLEVNGIEVSGKTLDQVTDMMVANSSNLIITVKPVNQRNNISPKRGGGSGGTSSTRGSQKSTGSLQSARSGLSFDSDEVRVHHEDEEDEVHDHLINNNTSVTSNGTSASSTANSNSSQSPPKDSTDTATTTTTTTTTTTATSAKITAEKTDPELAPSEKDSDGTVVTL